MITMIFFMFFLMFLLLIPLAITILIIVLVVKNNKKMGTVKMNDDIVSDNVKQAE